MPTPKRNLLGLIQGRLKVIEELPKRGKDYYWRCRCYCGNLVDYPTAYILHSTYPRRSCGMCYDEKKYPLEYTIWEGIRDRCNNSNRDRYKDYGGRGIKVCERWNDFLHFVEDMGFRPSKQFTIERDDVNGNYEPSNCYWLHETYQSLNYRHSRKYESKT